MAANVHLPDIYQRSADGNFYAPFNLRLDLMQRLLLINLRRDLDAVHLGCEPQVFDDPVNGRGLIVVAWRLDGKVDVYHQSTVTLRPENYDFVGQGLADLIERPFADAHYEVSSRGIDLQVAFEDKLGRSIVLHVRENDPHPRQPFSLLAPLPSGSEKPFSLPLVLLYDFYFVRQKQTEVEIVIDGRRHKPDTLPAPIDGTHMYFMRYSTDPFILHWNKDFTGMEAFKAASEIDQVIVAYLFPKNLLHHYGLTGKEAHLCPIEPQTICVSASVVPDIHAGDVETATIHTFYPGLARLEIAEQLPPRSVTDDQIMDWLLGGKAHEISPAGYLGNPREYKTVATQQNMNDYAERFTTGILQKLKAN